MPCRYEQHESVQRREACTTLWYTLAYETPAICWDVQKNWHSWVMWGPYDDGKSPQTNRLRVSALAGRALATSEQLQGSSTLGNVPPCSIVKWPF